jgi:hypothetical protein
MFITFLGHIPPFDIIFPGRAACEPDDNRRSALEKKDEVPAFGGCGT